MTITVAVVEMLSLWHKTPGSCAAANCGVCHYLRLGTQ